jgi:hypothetical protein
MHLMDEFARAFHSADRVVLLDIYAASEAPIEGVTSEALAARMREFGHRDVVYAGRGDAGVAEIVRGVEPGRPDRYARRRQRIATGRKNSGEAEGVVMPRPSSNQSKPKFNWGLAGVSSYGAASARVSHSGASKSIRSCCATRALRFSAIRARLAPALKFTAPCIPTWRGYWRSFAEDSGKSVFDIPLAERRRHLLAVDWVREASVMRVWPDRIRIDIVERVPVAFASLPIGGSARHGWR